MTKLLFYNCGKATFQLMFKQKNMRMIGFLEQESIQKKQDVTFLLRNKNVTLKENGGVFMRYKREFTKQNFEELLEMPYGRMVKAAAILQLIEEEGVTPEMIEKWGEYDKEKGIMYLVFEVEDIMEGVNGSEFFKRRDILDYCIALSEL